METDELPPDRSIEDLQRALADLVRTGSPAISAFAAWALEHSHEMAFHSVRGLARIAQTNVNTVYRLAVALGFSGFDECRAAFQAAMRQREGVYGARAARLNEGATQDLFDRLRTASLHNLEAVFDSDNLARLRQASALLLAARRVHCIGVRSCFSLAHFMSYSGRMAFENFARPLAEPGSIADTLTETTPDDVVVVISFSLYSAEVVRAHHAALARGAKVIAITDNYASPLARDAALVFCLPMDGPQTLPSQSAGFTLIETLIADMTAQHPASAARISDFEAQLTDLGSYVRAIDGPERHQS